MRTVRISAAPAWLLTAIIAAALAAPAASRAAESSVARAAQLQSVFECRKIAAPDARLACFDKATESLQSAEARGDFVTVDRGQVVQMRRQAFGFNMPTFNLFQAGAKAENIDRLSVDLSGAHHAADGKWVFETVDNQTWRQTDTQELYNDPHAGSVLAIRRAALGSFFCKIDGQSSVRCARER